MSIALLVMYMWAHAHVAVPKTSVHEACESATLCDSLVADDTGNITAPSATWDWPKPSYFMILNDSTGHLKARDSAGNEVGLPIQCNPLNPDKDGAYWTGCHIIKPAGERR